MVMSKQILRGVIIIQICLQDLELNLLTGN